MQLRIEPVAIIGIGCRFPGTKNPQAFWHILRNGVDAITEVPSERWDIDSFYHPEAAKPQKMNTRWSGFLEQVDQFEPSFFGIAPREAKHIDPQQRLLLEVTWEALENAGIVPESLAGSQTGVFIGISNADYHRLLYKDSSRIEAYSGTGTASSIASNRLSYLLNLRGPSLAIDTACSSSLVALHYACGSLLSQESNLCLVGGVNLILSPEPTITFSQARMMAADGRCKTFDASADGYVRGEGCGVVVLKRLSDALRDGDNIQAVIKGSAVNQDGLTNGLTAPNGPSQRVVIRQALEKAGVKPNQISYVETHGTGTSLGDPIEVNSLKTVLMEGRDENQPCWIGSAKTNIGHLESAAGMAGLIKVVLSLQHQKIPPHLHLKQLNPYIKIQNTPIQIPTELQPWQAGTEKRLAGVSSFGFGGTNAHIVLEEAPMQQSEVQVSDLGERSHHILTLSAKCEKALQELGQRYREFLGDNSTAASIADVCFSANTGRSHFNHRLAIITFDQQELAAKLAKISAGEEPSGVFSGKLSSKSKSPKIAFLFTGQGSQYIDMGRQLYESQPLFRETLEQCDRLLQPYIEKSILDVIYPENTKEINNSLIDQTAYTQPALFAIEYALFKLWQSWGIQPDVVMGHSVGEYVAATIAGVFSLEDGLKLIVHRGRLMQQLPPGGEMVAMMASEEQVNQLIAPYREKVALAAINGPESVVISGATAAIGTVRNKLEEEGIKTKQLQVSHAFHSPLMEPMLADFEAVANQITYHQPRIPLISNVTGTRADESIATASYWVNHVRQPVKFAPSIETLHQEGYELFLEIGPKPILLGMARQCLPEEVGVWLPSLRSGQSDWQQMLQSLAELYVRGVKVDWLGYDRDYSRSKVVLPTYPFQRQRYWIETSEDESQTTVYPSSESKTTTIVQCLNDGNTQQLAQQLEKVGKFSSEQVKLLPELLEILVQQHQEQFTTATIKDCETKPTKTKQHKLLERLKSLLEVERYDLLKTHIQSEVAKILGMTASQIDLQQPLNTMGLDSLMAMELRNRFKTHLAVDLPIVKFIEDISIVDVATEVNGQLRKIEKTQTVESEKNEQTLQLLRDRPDILNFYPLSYGQKALWFLWQLAPLSHAYNVSFTARICSVVDITAMEKAFEALRERHPILRTNFPKRGSEPIQQVHQNQELDFLLLDACTWSEDELKAKVVESHQLPFDLERGPVMRVRWFTRSNQEHVLLLTIHHIACDGWSIDLLIQELPQLYQAQRAGVEASLPSQYCSFND